MKTYNIDNIPVYLVGDLNNNYKKFKCQLEADENLKDCIFIFLGDMTFHDATSAFAQFGKLDAQLHERNIKSYIIRGNHDNPELWDENKHLDLWNYKFKSFHRIGSNARITINGNKGIIISGAISLNREELIPGVNYWPERDGVDLPDDIIDYGEGLKNIDFVIGHTGPVHNDIFKEQKTACEKYLKDGFLVEDLEHEQKTLRSILRRYRPKRWYCGHYHIEKDTKYVWDNWSDDGVIHLRIINKQQIVRIA